MRLALPRMNLEDVGSTSTAVFYCAPSTPAIRYHNKLPAMRGFIPDVCQTISPIDFLCAQLFRWEVCGSPIAYPVNFDPDGVRWLSKISLSSAVFYLFSLPLICRARIDIYIPICPVFLSIFLYLDFFYKIIFYESVSK